MEELLALRLLVILDFDYLDPEVPVYDLLVVEEALEIQAVRLLMQKNLPRAFPGRAGKEGTHQDQEVQKKPRKPRRKKEKNLYTKILFCCISWFE